MKERKNANGKNADATYRLGIDLGGTKILAGVVTPYGELVGVAKKKTKAEGGPDVVIKRILDTASEALDEAKVSLKSIASVGIGAPGPVDYQTGVVYSAPNLPGWNEIPLGSRLEAALKAPVRVENDANLGTWGEWSLGAGRGTQHMVGIFVGTGVGGGVIIDGKLHRGARYAAGEVGHMIIQPNGPECGCGRRGCVEAFASRTAIERAVVRAVEQGRSSILPELMAADKSRLSSSTIKAALEAGDELMIELMSQVQFYLGLLTANLVNALDPEMVVFGGGVVEALGDAFLQPIRDTAVGYYLQQRQADQIRIAPATLGDNAGVLGGAALAGAFIERKS